MIALALAPPLQALARKAACALRMALRRAALTAAAMGIATLGAAFVVYAGFLGLAVLMGPGFAALSMGLAFLATAACLLLLARANGHTARFTPPAPDAARHPIGGPQTPLNAATVAIFTLAFLLGRRLINRRGPSHKF